MSDNELEHFVQVAIHSLSKHGLVDRQVIWAVEVCLARAQRMRALETVLIDVRLENVRLARELELLRTAQPDGTL
jgi:hypothetical protein